MTYSFPRHAFAVVVCFVIWSAVGQSVFAEDSEVVSAPVHSAAPAEPMVTHPEDSAPTAKDLTANQAAIQLEADRLAAEARLEHERRATAIALNYCRASFHRIRRYPTKRVMIEEREKILNNLNLNGIEDPEVITLYTSVLDEIGSVEMAEKEEKYLDTKYRETFRRRLGTNALVLGTELATAQIASAARTGANSWWDYRETGWNRDLDVWKVEKGRMTSVLGKTNTFLDTFWKLAQKKKIPDEWLVRGSDLDRLEEALREPDPETRLRVLQRMERFMVCYPPYWYHVARTQQARGQLFAAADTYRRLEGAGAGHFRQDDMLAAGLANQAVIQEYLAQSEAPKTALRALTYSTSVWEANLMCARVLERHQSYRDAEEAVLCNLDVDLERDNSLVALLSLYVDSGNTDKLRKSLGDTQVVQNVPVPVLLRCAAFLGSDRLPLPVVQHLAMSLKGTPQVHLGRDDFVVTANPAWQLADADISLEVGGRRYPRPQIVQRETGTHAIFPKILDVGHPLAMKDHGLDTVLHLKYENLPEIHLHMGRTGPARVASGQMSFLQVPVRVVSSSMSREEGELRITRFDIEETRVTLGPDSLDAETQALADDDSEESAEQATNSVPVQLISQPEFADDETSSSQDESAESWTDETPEPFNATSDAPLSGGR